MAKRLPPKRHFPPEPLTRAEADALISAALDVPRVGLRNAALLAVMYRGGLRISEALSLRPVDVDVTRHTARVLHGKGDKARLAYIGAGASDLVSRWLAVRGTALGPLFCTRAGGRMNDRYVRPMMGRMASKAGIAKRCHPHGLRHSHACEMADAGVPINVISKQLGHSNSAVTARYIDHITNADVAFWIERMEWHSPA